MSDNTGIEWTDATWNPVTGCTEVSPGCDHCYAKTFAERWRGTAGHYFENGFDVQLRPDKLEQPLRWKKPRKIFVNSMSDLFHDQIPDEYIAKVFAVMALAPQHTFQVLTKRHGRMRSLLDDDQFIRKVWNECDDIVAREYQAGFTDWPLPNVWVGVSAENQQWANIRIPALLATPAAVRFVSAEPLLGPIDLAQSLKKWAPSTDHPAWQGLILPSRDVLHWVIVGGESGPGARPMHPDWPRQIRDDCAGAGIAFLFKQWGEHLPSSRGMRGYSKVTDRYVFEDGSGDVELANWHAGLPSGALMQRVGKKAAGRMFDGRTYDEYPVAVTS